MPKHLTESVDGSITSTLTFTTGTCAVSPGGTFKADSIEEYTTSTGVTIDGVHMKDYAVNTTGLTVATYLSRGAASRERARYYINDVATDHGIAGSGTISSLCTAIGTSKNATIVITHNGTGTTTAIPFSTAWDGSSYSNITFEFENGAQVEPGSGITGVTLASPNNIKAQFNQQITSGTSLYFGTKGRTPVKWWPNTVAGINAAITASAGGGVAYFPSGTYTLDSITPLATASDIILEGDGRDVTILDATSGTTMFQGSANLRVKGVNFHDWSAVLDYSSVNDTVDWIEFEDCLFTKVANTALVWDSPLASAKLEKLVVRNCTFSGSGSRDLNGGVQLQVPMDEAHVIGNVFHNMSGRPIILGQSVYANQDIMQRYFVSHNRIEDINTGTANLTGILAYGRDVSITDNIITDLSRTDEDTLIESLEGIYTKARNYNISGNILRDAGRREGAIIVKGNERDGTTHPRGYSGIISNNAIYSGVSNSSGIMINDSEVDCHDNVIEGTGWWAINLNVGNMNNVNIHDNLIKNHNGVYGIYLEADGDRIRVHHNTIDGVDNVWLRDDDAAGIMVYPSAGVTIYNLDISNNIISGVTNAKQLLGSAVTSYGIYLYGQAGSGVSNAIIKDNKLIDINSTGIRVRQGAYTEPIFEGNLFQNTPITITQTNATIRPTFRSNRNMDDFALSIADDGVYTFTPPAKSGIMTVSCGTTGTANGMVGYQTDSGVTCYKMGGGGYFNATTGQLVGNTGTDNYLTVSTGTTGVIYIENRLGGVVTLRARIIEAQ